MRDRSQRSSRWTVVVAATAGIAIASSLMSMASAETYSTPGDWTVLSVGTDGSNTDSAYVTVSHGGCSMHGYVSIAVTDSGRDCRGNMYNGTYWGTPDAIGLVGIGLLGGDSAGEMAVSDTGDAQACGWGLVNLSCLLPGAAASGTGNAEGVYAVSGTGNARGQHVSGGGTAVSGTGHADATHPWYPGGTAVAGGGYANAGSGYAVSGLRDANGGAGSVSGFGTSRARGCTGSTVDDTVGGYAVSVFGNAYGCTSVSVTGEAGPGSP